jgi:hypothetical protein
VWCNVGPETQGGSLALRCYHQADRYLSILGMVAWLSDDQRQEETKQGSKISLLRVQKLACLGITGAMRTTPTNAVEALTCLPPLELVVQGEARSAANRFWSLGSWSYLHPNRGHCCILMRLQQSDHIFNMGVDVMRPAYNFEPQNSVTMLTREDWTKATGAPPAVKGLIWFTDGSKMRE